MTSSIERLFEVHSAAFLAEHWPDRLAFHCGDHVASASELGALISELHLEFAAHACAVVAREESAPSQVTDREIIIAGVRGAQRWRVGSASYAIVPGAALFIPRGSSLEVDASPGSQVLAFTFRVPTWIEMLSNTLMTELAHDAAWRAPVASSLPTALADASRDAIALLASAPPPRSRDK